MRGAGEEVAAHVGGQRDIGLGVRAHQVGRFAQKPELQRAEGLEDFGAGLGGGAAIQHAGRGPVARGVGIVAPPEHGFAARLITGRGAAAHGETEVERKLPRGDMRIRAVPDDAPGFVLVEAQVNIAADEVAGLRIAAADRPT